LPRADIEFPLRHGVLRTAWRRLFRRRTSCIGRRSRS
jgi:hypothetical protein